MTTSSASSCVFVPLCGQNLLTVSGLTKTFRQRRGVFGGGTHEVRALESVSLEIARGETLGLVGESGSGKSTLGRCLLRLSEPDSGSVLWHETNDEQINVTALDRKALQRFRPRMQVVFQDPYHSLNPSRPVWQIVGEGLFIRGSAPSAEIRERSAEALKSVGLKPEHLDRLPHAFSGGQRQRIAIARALIMEPEFIVCDEVTSALDTRTQAQVLELLREIQKRLGVTLLFISHDLHTVARVSREVLVMHEGRIVERGEPGQIFRDPQAEYTRTLVAAVPNPDPRKRTFRAS